MSDHCLILSNSLAHALFHYSQQVAVAIVDKKIIIIVFFDQLWRMSVEGVNAVAGQELKDPPGQRTSPAQPGASQKWAFPLTACCVLCSLYLALAHIFFLQIITLFSITEMCHWLQYSWITDTKGNLSSTNRLGKQSNERNVFLGIFPKRVGPPSFQYI